MEKSGQLQDFIKTKVDFVLKEILGEPKIDVCSISIVMKIRLN